MEVRTMTTSIGLYQKRKKEHDTTGAIPGISAIMEILNQMKYELVHTGDSPLLEEAESVCEGIAGVQDARTGSTEDPLQLSGFDAFALVYMMAEAVEDRLSTRNMAKLVPHMMEERKVPQDSWKWLPVFYRKIMQYAIVHHSEKNASSDEIASIRSALMEVNQSVRHLEDSLHSQNASKAVQHQLELFNLIADTRDSLKGSGNPDPEAYRDNLCVFLDMIAENLVDFHAEMIQSRSGDAFSGKYQTAVNADDAFDPGKAIVKETLRPGFMLEDQVIQKERVRV